MCIHSRDFSATFRIGFYLPQSNDERGFFVTVCLTPVPQSARNISSQLCLVCCYATMFAYDRRDRRSAFEKTNGGARGGVVTFALWRAQLAAALLIRSALLFGPFLI